jgi:RHS repeat-associated protein
MAKPGSNNLGRFQYTGQKWYPELGLYDYKARVYHPSLGRFMQTDPIGLGGGMNVYGYVGGDPVHSSDPLGLRVEETDILVTGRRGRASNNGHRGPYGTGHQWK